MEFGIHSAFHAGSVDLAEFAARCEQLGFESLWLPEHTVIPVNPSVGPGGAVGETIPDSYLLMTDPLIGLTVVAAATKTLRLGTGVLLIPEHHPVDLAKRISSLDLYSNGRFVLGVGAGWQPEESAALGGDFLRRWAQTTESIAVMKKLWTEDEPEHDGHYYSFPPLKFHPQPVQKPTPPILLGGGSKRLFDRIAGWADGWAPWSPSPDDVVRGRAALVAACGAVGRDAGEMSVTAFTGSRDAETIAAFEAAGVDRLVVTMASTADRKPFSRVEEIARAAKLALSAGR
jgi:probable F420-dependent oxidoreductase